MSLSVYEQVISLTNRPALRRETRHAIQLALSYFHHLEDWDQDTQTITSFPASSMTVEDGVATVDLSLLDPPYDSVRGNCLKLGGKPACVSTCGCADGGYVLSGGKLKFPYTPMGASCHNPCAPFGSGALGDGYCFTYMASPHVGLEDCEITGSWIADSHPELVAAYAAAYIESIVTNTKMKIERDWRETLLRGHLNDTGL